MRENTYWEKVELVCLRHSVAGEFPTLFFCEVWNGNASVESNNCWWGPDFDVPFFSWVWIKLSNWSSQLWFRHTPNSHHLLLNCSSSVVWLNRAKAESRVGSVRQLPCCFCFNAVLHLTVPQWNVQAEFLSKCSGKQATSPWLNSPLLVC